MNKLEFNKRQSEEIDKIFKSLVEEFKTYQDIRNLIIIFHTRIEFLIERILVSYFFIEDDEKRKNFKKNIIQKLSFNEKYKLLKKTNLLDENLKQTIPKINELRNICVHEILHWKTIAEKIIDINFCRLETLVPICIRTSTKLVDVLAKINS